MAMDEAAKRRVRAGRLLQQGKGPAEVAHLVGAPRQTVYRWREVLHAKGIEPRTTRACSTTRCQ